MFECVSIGVYVCIVCTSMNAISIGISWACKLKRKLPLIGVLCACTMFANAHEMGGKPTILGGGALADLEGGFRGLQLPPPPNHSEQPYPTTCKAYYCLLLQWLPADKLCTMNTWRTNPQVVYGGKWFTLNMVSAMTNLLSITVNHTSDNGGLLHHYHRVSRLNK